MLSLTYFAFALLALFALAEIRSLIIIYLRLSLRSSKTKYAPATPEYFPSVTVQLPVYREHLVLDRVLSSVLEMDYPSDRLTVQVIDNSEEHEAALARAVVRRYQEGPVRVDFLHRAERTGYKSGNLNWGLRHTTAELVAIFDADCEPDRDFLLSTVSYFQNERVGGVQARWIYINDLESPLNVMQAAILDTLFCFEMAVRDKLGLSGFFLGTGGVWRLKTLEHLGGWQEFPFTAEDFDLSYRARLAGWHVAYEERPLLSCELPNTFLAYKDQQRRWARSCFRLLIDHLPAITRSGWSGILETTMLLRLVGMQMIIPLAIFVSLYVSLGLPRSTTWIVLQVLLTATMVFSPTLLELILSQKLLYKNWLNRTLALFRAVPLAVGLSISLFAGLWETLWHSEREWSKTLRSGEDGVSGGSHRRWLLNALPIAIAEVLFGLIAGVGLTFALRNGYWESILFLWLVAGGYLISAWTSLSELYRRFDLKPALSILSKKRP